MADVGFKTQLVAFGNDGTNLDVWYEDLTGSDPNGDMVELDTSADELDAETLLTAIPAGQAVYIAQGTDFKYIDFTVDPPTWNTWTAASGSLPANANLGAHYRGRIVLAGDTTAPNMWYMSRQGDYTDFLYGANDAQSAVAGGDAEAAQAGDIITCLAVYQDDFLVIGGAHTVELMRGDPAAGGTLDTILSTDGIFGPDSYAFDADGNMYFVGTLGVYRMQRGGSIPSPLTPGRLPDFMKGISRETHRIVMGYDNRRHGMLIGITKISDGTGTHWWYDLRTDGFFPETYIDGLGPYSMLFYDADDEDFRQLVLGCGDGYIRYFDSDEKADEDAGGTPRAINSKALLGPLDLSAGGGRGKINKLQVITGSNSDSAVFNIYVADSAEELLDDVQAATTAIHSGTISGGGRQYTIHAKARGAALAIHLTNAAISTSFAIEKITGNVEGAGRIKQI